MHRKQENLPVIIGRVSVEVWVGSCSLWGQVPWQQQSWEVPIVMVSLGVCSQHYHGAYRLLDWFTSGQTTNREGVQIHPSAENWIKVLLSMVLPIRKRSNFPNYQPLLPGILHKCLSLQREERRHKKNYHPTTSRKKATVTESSSK